MKLFSVLKGAAVSVFCLVAILGASQMVGAQTTRGNDQRRHVTTQGSNWNNQQQQYRANGRQDGRDSRDNDRYDRNRHDRDNDQVNSRYGHHDRDDSDYRKYNNGGSKYRSNEKSSWHKHETTFNQIRNGHRY